MPSSCVRVCVLGGRKWVMRMISPVLEELDSAAIRKETAATKVKNIAKGDAHGNKNS